MRGIILFKDLRIILNSNFMPETKNQKTKHKEETDWKDTALSVVKTFFENFFAELTRNVKQKIELFVIKLRNNLISLSLFLLGLIFLIVGITIMLEYLIKIPGLGYMIVGLVLLLFGTMMKMRSK